MLFYLARLDSTRQTQSRMSDENKIYSSILLVRANTMAKHEVSGRKVRNLWKFIPNKSENFENIGKSFRVWFMWIWAKLLELFHIFGGAMRVVKVSRGFNLCTFCLNPLAFFDYISVLFVSRYVNSPFRLKAFQQTFFPFGKLLLGPGEKKWIFIRVWSFMLFRLIARRDKMADQDFIVI